MFSLVPERLSASQAASKEQRLEAEREQNDDERLEEDERRWRVAKAANNTVVALLFFLDFFPNVGFGVAPTRPLVSESFQRPPRDTGEDVHVRVLEAVRSA